MKICRRCLLSLPLEEFPKHPQMADRHLNVCRRCKAEQARVHYAIHKDKIGAANKERAKRPEAREKSRNAHAAWRAAHPDRWRETQRRANENYRGTEKEKARVARRHEREQSTRTSHVSLRSVEERWGMVCHICGKPIEDRRLLTFDHVIPLARGGSHTEENLRPAHRRCNSWKSDRLMSALAGQRPPEPGELDDWEDRRREKVRASKSEKMKEWWRTHDATERNAKISAAMKGNTRGLGRRYKQKRPRSPEENAARAAAVKASWTRKTPEQMKAHAQKISDAKRRTIG